MMATRRGPQLSNLTYDKACEAVGVIRRKAADSIMARGAIAPATGRIDSRTQGADVASRIALLREGP